jgi:hypothetical protein
MHVDVLDPTLFAPDQRTRDFYTRRHGIELPRKGVLRMNGLDPYLGLAKEVRDKIQIIIDDAEEGGGLGCLINCTNPGTQPELAVIFDHVLNCLRIAVHLMESAVERIEEEGDSDSEDGSTWSKCRICGCTDYTPCAGGCYWVDDPEDPMGDGLCSRCLEEHYPDIAAKRLAAYPDHPLPLMERVEGELDALVHADPPGERPE